MNGFHTNDCATSAFRECPPIRRPVNTQNLRLQRTLYKGGDPLQSCFSDSLYNQPFFPTKKGGMDPHMDCKTRQRHYRI